MAYKKSELTREQILSVSKTLFYDHGFGETTMRQIAKHCGITSPLLYYYFESKTDIAFDIMAKYYDKIDEVLAQYLSFDDFPMLYVLCVPRMLIKELSKDPAEIKFYSEIYESPLPNRPFVRLIHNAVVKHKNDEKFPLDVVRNGIIIGDSIWYGFVKSIVSGEVEMDLNELQDLCDLHRYTHIGLSESAIKNLISVAKGIVENIPVQGIRVID